MTHLKYRDYQGSVTYVDGTLLIQILHIDDLITTECEHASRAQSAFEELVEDYLATCAEQNKQPSKPFKGSFNVRITPALHRAIAMQAAERGESLNAYIQSALEERIERSRSHDRLMASLSAMNYSRLSHAIHADDWSNVTLKTRMESPVREIVPAVNVYRYAAAIRGMRI